MPVAVRTSTPFLDRATARPAVVEPDALCDRSAELLEHDWPVRGWPLELLETLIRARSVPAPPERD